MKPAHYEKRKETLYCEVASKLELQIVSGVYKRGEKLPSLRELSRRLGVSINTAREAYGNLEMNGIVRGIPQSGYYVTDNNPEERISSIERPEYVSDDFLSWYNTMIENSIDPERSPFACALFDLKALPYTDKMTLSRETQTRMNIFNYPAPQGLPELRKEIARRSIDAGIMADPDDIIITEGSMSAIALAVKLHTKPGDTVALESPFYYNFLYLLREYGLKVIEIPTDPVTGMNLDILEFVTSRHPVKAVITVPTNHNPLGFTMPAENKIRLVELLERQDILLFEDDIYGDISFTEKREPACKAFDKSGRVILCSSFSKSLSPGLRLGWMIPGIWKEKILAVKTMTNISTALPSQVMALHFMQSGYYDRHLRQLRKKASERLTALREAVCRHLPPEVKVTAPSGGFILWLTLPGSGDMDRIYELCRQGGMVFSPGRIFSLEGRWNNCIRLSAGYYTSELENKVQLLGKVISENWDFRQDYY